MKKFQRNLVLKLCSSNSPKFNILIKCSYAILLIILYIAFVIDNFNKLILCDAKLIVIILGISEQQLIAASD